MNELKINRNLARFVLLGLGVIALIVMAVALIAAPMNKFNTVSYAALGVGILGLAGFVLLDPEAFVAGITGRTSQYGATTILMSLIFIVFVVAIYILVDALAIEPYPLTDSEKYQLSQQTKDILAGLEDEVHVVGFYTDQETTQQDEAKLWLQKYEKYSDGKLTYEFVDPDRDPLRATELEMTRSGVMVFSRGEQTAEASYADERTMSSALVRVLSGEARKLYMITGHGERSTDDYSGTGFSQIGSLLGNVGFEIESLNLLEKGSVPEDASMVVVAGPTAQFSAIEVEALKAYLDSGGKALFMFDPATGGGQLGDGLLGVSFSSDGSHLATAGADGTIRIWELGTSKQLLEMRGHTSDVMDVAYSPNDKRLASAGRDGTVRVWDTSIGEQIKLLEGQTEGARRVAYSPDGRLLASVGENQVLNIWNARTLEPMDYSPISVPAPLYTVEFSPDSKLIAAGSGLVLSSGAVEGTVYLWDSRTGEAVLNRTLHTSVIFDVAFSPDGTTLHSVAWDGTEGILDIDAGEGSTETLYPNISITSLAIKKDGTKIYSLADGSIHVRPPEATSTDQDVVLNPHTDTIWVLKLSPDGDTVATGSRDGTAGLWSLDASSGSALKAQGGGDPLLNYLKDSWGIQVNDDVVIDMWTASEYNQFTPVIYTFAQMSSIVQSLSGNYVIFPVARSIEPVETAPEDITLTSLLFSSDEQVSSWGETEPYSSSLQFDPLADLPGPVTMGVSAEHASTGARIVVYGDADFASDANMAQFANGDLALNTANWLTESEELIDIPVKDLGSRTMESLSGPAMTVAIITSVCLIPGVGLVAGLVVWIVRRRRR
ncbi:MAG: Gldg family protein [Anaerolineae bacterium]|nr:Gldg family protein [Anaerolineae bacterium]